MDLQGLRIRGRKVTNIWYADDSYFDGFRGKITIWGSKKQMRRELKINARRFW